MIRELVSSEDRSIVDCIKKTVGSHEECIKLLEQLRHNGISVCCRCGSTHTYRMRNTNRYDQIRCLSCRHTFTPITETFFHRAHGLHIWFMVIGILSLTKIKSSSCIAVLLNIRQPTVWKIMKALKCTEDSLVVKIRLWLRKEVIVHL